MTTLSCERWHGAIAMFVLGDLSLEESTGLRAHLEGCGGCRAVATEMDETVSLLRYVDPFSVEATALVPPSLSDQVLRDLFHVGVVQRRRHRLRWVAVGVVGAMAAASLLVIAFNGSTAPPTVARTLTLHGATSVQASATLIEQNWGTSLELIERGLPGGEVYTVSMKTTSGTWWTAGTYSGVADTPVSATMACSVAWGRISGVRVVNSTGVTVLSSYADETTKPY